MKRYIAFMILSSFVLENVAWSATSCPELFSRFGKLIDPGVTFFLGRPKAREAFSMELYQRAKEQIEYRLDRGLSIGPLQIGSPEAKMALIDTIVKRQNIDALDLGKISEIANYDEAAKLLERQKENGINLGMDRLAQDINKKEFAILQKVLKPLENNDGTYESELLDIIDAIDSIAMERSRKENAFNIWGVDQLKNMMTIPLPKSMMKDKLEHTILHNDLVTAFEKIGLLREPGNIEHFKQWVGRNELAIQTIVTVSLNTLTLAKYHFMSHIPRKALLTESKKAPAELISYVKELIISKGKNRGLAEAEPRLREFFGYRPEGDFAILLIQKAFAFGISAMLVAYLYENYPLFKTLIAMRFASKEKLQKWADEHFDPKRIRKEQLESWKKAFEAFEGRKPDRSNHKDRAEWDRTWQNLIETPDEDLRIVWIKEVKTKRQKEEEERKKKEAEILKALKEPLF